ncbi:GTPase [Aureococcus anophagefferens]|nr:GTPase [Aureococcus anophagefferens]
MYYRNAAAAIVCFDVTDESTFNTMKDWVEELKTNVSRAEQFARSISAIVLDTSAKENFGVAELFAAVSEHVIKLRGQELCSTPGAPRGGGGGPGGRGLSLAARAAGFRDDQQSASSCSNC